MKFSYVSDTLQGEGTYSGVVVDIVRVVGCGVGCRFCDEPGGESVEYVSGMLPQLRCGSQRPILLTGGEPLQQLTPELAADIACEVHGGRVPMLMVETSGVGDWSILHSLFASVWKRAKNVLTISPKKVDITPLRVGLLHSVDELVIKYLWSERQKKFVAVADSLAGDLRDYTGRASLVVQPVDSGQIYGEFGGVASWYERNLKDIEKSLRHDTVACIIKDKWREVHRVLPQLHKIIDMP